MENLLQVATVSYRDLETLIISVYITLEIGFTQNSFPGFYGFRILYEEIDYINEGKNADRFRRDFRNIKWVRVPVCFLDLTMQFIFGV